MDLFEREQRIYDNAVRRAEQHQNGARIGHDDYCSLTREYGKLLRQLRRVTKISDKTTDSLNASRQDLLGKVHYDALTGIYNRRYMEENLRRVVKSVSRAGGLLSILMIDIDFFKKYNDTYGHSMGDSCLKTVAETLAESLTRADDFVARYGGEEFIAVLPNTDENGARLIAERLLEHVRLRRIPHEKNGGCVTVSIGVTTCHVTHTQSGAETIKRADEALYLSKQGGRNRYTFVNDRGKTQ